MERLTFCRGKGFHVGYSSEATKYPDREQAVKDRLFEFEQLGLTPEEISTLKAERDALLKYVPPICELCKFESLSFGKEPCASCPDNCSSFEWSGLGIGK